MLETQRDLATKTVYALIGAPVVAARLVRDYGPKLADEAQTQFTVLADEGEKAAKKLRNGDVVEDLQSRVDLDKVQDRVEKLRDQLEGALHSWRESFTPADTKPEAKKVTVESSDDAPPTTASTEGGAKTETTETETSETPVS